MVRSRIGTVLKLVFRYLFLFLPIIKNPVDYNRYSCAVSVQFSIYRVVESLSHNNTIKLLTFVINVVTIRYYFFVFLFPITFNQISLSNSRHTC